MNQLKLSRQLTGSLEVGERGLQIQARGLRPDEALDVDLASPTFSGRPALPDAASPHVAAADPAAAAAEGAQWGRQAGRSIGDRLAGRSPAREAAPKGHSDGGGHFSLRSGPLSVSAEVRMRQTHQGGASC